MIFNYYEADIKKSFPLGSVSLDYVLNAIKEPKKDIRHIFEQIREAEERKDMAKKQELKTKLYSFTPCVFVEGSRKYANIKHFTGLLVLDFDHIETVPDAIEFKQYLFDRYFFIKAIWLSASKHGVRAIVKIPICKSVEEFKHYFNAINEIFKSYKYFDTAPKNCILPMFISYDPDILIRETPWTFQKKLIPVIKPIVKQYIIDDKTTSIERIIKYHIDKIVDNGHPQLRAAAYLLGGYVGAGYIDEDNAIQTIDNLILSNGYLSQKASVYITTAKTMITKGKNEPIYLNK